MIAYTRTCFQQNLVTLSFTHVNDIELYSTRFYEYNKDAISSILSFNSGLGITVKSSDNVTYGLMRLRPDGSDLDMSNAPEVSIKDSCRMFFGSLTSNVVLEVLILSDFSCNTANLPNFNKGKSVGSSTGNNLSVFFNTQDFIGTNHGQAINNIVRTDLFLRITQLFVL